MQAQAQAQAQAAAAQKAQAQKAAQEQAARQRQQQALQQQQKKQQVQLRHQQAQQAAFQRAAAAAAAAPASRGGGGAPAGTTAQCDPRLRHVVRNATHPGCNGCVAIQEAIVAIRLRDATHHGVTSRVTEGNPLRRAPAPVTGSAIITGSMVAAQPEVSTTHRRVPQSDSTPARAGGPVSGLDSLTPDLRALVAEGALSLNQALAMATGQALGDLAKPDPGAAATTGTADSVHTIARTNPGRNPADFSQWLVVRVAPTGQEKMVPWHDEEVCRATTTPPVLHPVPQPG